MIAKLAADGSPSIASESPSGDAFFFGKKDEKCLIISIGPSVLV